MQTIAVVNLKGGSAKTSTTFHIGGTLAARGSRVLWVDADPQGSLTQGLFGPAAFRDLDPEASVAACYESDPLPERIIAPAHMSRLWLIPGHQDAATSNMLPRDQWGQRTESIRSVLQEIHSDFDFCIIDTPPNLHLCTYAAIRAADHVVVPLAPEDFGAQGLVAVGRAIRSVAIEHGSPLVLGYLLSLFDQRLSIHHAYADRLTEIYGGLVFSTRVPLLSAYKEAVAARKPISHFRPRSPAGKVFESLADEIQQRLAIGVVAA